MVYVPTEQQDGNGAGEFLILDIWHSMEGLNTFFANPQVQEQAGQIFSSRDPVVWAPADGLTGYHFPAPPGRTNATSAWCAGWCIRTRRQRTATTR